MGQDMQHGSGSRRRSALVAPVAILIVALAAAALVTWLVVIGGLEVWMVALMLGAALIAAFVLAD